ncbi:MAG TPA: DUF6364 family protein [Cyclobacteriaceae bacterium]|jgi:hypothetical protein
MKTKLTLTVRKDVVEAARRLSRTTGKSISAMFEEVFSASKPTGLKTEQQRAAARLLKTLRKADEVETLDDETLIRKHVTGKFA